MKLPNKIIALKNEDKLFHERWTKKRGMLNIPHPFRVVLCGRPNCGKSTTIKNLLIRANPPFERLVVIHCDPEFTKEYDDFNVVFREDLEPDEKTEEIPTSIIMGRIPSPSEWPGDVKTAVILDDLNYKKLKTDQFANLDRLFGFCSTHKNISVMLATQDPFQVVPCVRRMSNMWIIWKGSDMDSLKMLARKCGMKQKDFISIMENLLVDHHDSLWIDMTKNSPFPFRLNGFTKLKKRK